MSNGDNGSAVYNILAFTFDGQPTAGKIVREIKSSGALEGYYIVAECVVEQDAKGKVHIHEPGHGGVGAVIGAVGGGFLALIGGPVGLLAMTVGGGVLGGVAGHYLGRPISKGDLREIGEALSPDSSAFLLLLEDIYSEGVINDMADYNAKVVTLTVGDELSGEIQSYVAGQATDAAGNEVDVAAGVAVDAAGNVAAAGEVAASDAGESEKEETT